MKGEILRRSPAASILDLSHNVPRQSVEQGAFMLHCAVDSFPRKTIFCCVVDPGVGSSRRGMVGWVGDYGYVGPDNGLVTPLLWRSGGHCDLYEIKSQTFRNSVVSPTFHGRDVFAPAAARLQLGDDPRMAGPRVADPKTLPPIEAKLEGSQLLGKVMLIDHFGNAVTNIQQSQHAARLQDGAFRLAVKGLAIEKIASRYTESPVGEALCYWGSSGFLEIAVNFGSASAAYDIHFGDPVTVDLR
jgi:hypothetical protein